VRIKHHDGETCGACDALAEAAGTQLCRKAGAHITATQILADIRAIDGMCAAARRSAAAQLTAAAAAIMARWELENGELSGGKESATPAAEWSLTIEDLIARTDKTRRWLFKHRHLPFIRSISRKTIIGDETLLRRWISQQRA
jgi:hypothetical protein